MRRFLMTSVSSQAFTLRQDADIGRKERTSIEDNTSDIVMRAYNLSKGITTDPLELPAYFP